MKKIITCILFFLLSGCASTVPLPPQIDIYRPSPEISPKLAAFSGAWEGQWNSMLDTILVVKDIDSNTARIGFGLGKQMYDISPNNSYVEYTARIIDDSSIGWKQSNGNEFIFKIDESLNTITGTFIDYIGKWRKTAYLRRIKLEDFPDVKIKYYEVTGVEKALENGSWRRIEFFDIDCNSNSHKIIFNRDKSEVAFIFQQSADSADAKHNVDKYKIININDKTITMSLIGETRKDDIGNLAVWNLVFEEPDKYYWHRTDWPADRKVLVTKKCKGT